MDLKELSESVVQSAPVLLTSPKKHPVRSSFLLNLDKTIESCKAQLGENVFVIYQILRLQEGLIRSLEYQCN